jgi:hypothetical protein
MPHATASLSRFHAHGIFVEAGLIDSTMTMPRFCERWIRWDRHDPVSIVRCRARFYTNRCDHP